jgi:hypothetical protein
VIEDLEALRRADRFRFANVLRAWVEVEEGQITGHGYSGDAHVGVTTLHLGSAAIAVPALALPTIQQSPQVTAGAVRFVQTAGGRTGVPAPRPVPRKPFFQFFMPVAWTTLALTIRADGSSSFDLIGASPFPRHWIYDGKARLARKTGLTDFGGWMNKAVGDATPWGKHDSPALTAQVESALERELSTVIMKGEHSLRRVAQGSVVCEQGEAGTEVFLLLDGMLMVEVDGKPLAEIGPGAILGERATLEGGRRGATLRALTPCKVAVTDPGYLDAEEMAALARDHRREEA